MSRLKNCPFCGTIAMKCKDEKLDLTIKYYICCCYCASQTRKCDSMISAIRAWNKRVKAEEV